MKNLKETSLYVMVSNEFINSRHYGWNDQCTDIIIESTFSAFASFLGMVKNKDTTTAVVIKDIYGEFCFGAFVQFHKSEEEGTDEGSWTLNYTFDKNDIEDSWKVYDFAEDMEVANNFYTVAYTKYGMGFATQPKDDNNAKPEGSAQDLVTIIFNMIKEYMRANITIDPQLDITDIATLTAAVADDNSVVIGIEPSALMKQYVKDDADIKE